MGITKCTLSTSHSNAASTSILSARAKLHISADKPSETIFLIPSLSPSEVIADPASITSTPNSSNLMAILNFSSGVRETPGVCSPSLSVVSNILTSTRNPNY